MSLQIRPEPAQAAPGHSMGGMPFVQFLGAGLVMMALLPPTALLAGSVIRGLLAGAPAWR